MLGALVLVVVGLVMKRVVMQSSTPPSL